MSNPPMRVGMRLRRAALLVVRRVLNPVVVGLARRQRVGRVSLLEHRGRRSGRLYTTTVQAQRAPDGSFYIPLTWGEQADWYRNIRAAGGCIIHWQGGAYRLSDPQLVDGPAARATFHPFERLVLALGRIQLVHLARAELSAGPHQTSGSSR